MKLSVKIYLVIYILVLPLFLYDMYVEKTINITFIVATILLVSFLKGKNKEDAGQESHKSEHT